MRTVMETGVYRRDHNTIQIDLNVANQVHGNAINLMPTEHIPEPSNGPRALMLTRTSLKRLLSYLEDRP